MSLWRSISKWFEAQGGVAHVLAAAYVFVVTAYATVPDFKLAIDSVYGRTPHWLHQTVAAVVGLVAFYWRTKKIIPKETLP